eukprot:4057590-Alexandrium_andersonii.AAC.1
MLERNIPLAIGSAKNGLRAVSKCQVLARAEGARGNVRSIGGIVADADPGPRCEVLLGIQPEEGFRDGRDLARIVASNLGPQEEAGA